MAAGYGGVAGTDDVAPPNALGGRGQRVMAQRMPNLRRTGPTPWSSMIGSPDPPTLPLEFDPGH